METNFKVSIVRMYMYILCIYLFLQQYNIYLSICTIIITLSEEKPVDASYVKCMSGIQVWATFKWITMAIEGQTYPTVYFESHPNVALRSRRRWYMEGKIKLSQHRLPLYLHALAKLDVFQLTHMFKTWKLWVEKIINFTKRGWRKRMRDALMFWFRNTIKELRCKRAEYLLVYSRRGMNVFSLDSTYI